MNRLEVIGNLGADAEVKTENGKQFVSLSIADTSRRKKADGTTQESTMWVSATINGDGGELLKYRVKGAKVCAINIELWQEGYATQLNMYTGGGTTPAPVSELYWRYLTANNDDGISVTRQCIVTADGKLMKVHDHNGEDYYFFAAHEDSSTIYWTIDNCTTEVDNFSEAAGGYTQVEGKVNKDTTNFTYNDVQYYFETSKFTPNVVGELTKQHHSINVDKV